MKVEFRGQVFEFDKRMKVKELLEKLNLSPESTIVIRGDEVLIEDEWIEEDDEVKVISAISGGCESLNSGNEFTLRRLTYQPMR